MRARLDTAPRSLRSALAVRALFATSVLLLGCGPSPDGAAPTPPLAVLQREFAWEARHPSPPVPLTLVWSFGDGAAGWLQPDGAPAPWRNGALQIDVQGGPLLLDSPPGAPLDPELQQTLVLSGVPAADGAGVQLVVQWRAEGQEFSAERSTSPLPLPGLHAGPHDAPPDPASAPSEPPPAERAPSDPALQSWTLPFEQLRGVREATDASEGLAQLRLRFERAPAAPSAALAAPSTAPHAAPHAAPSAASFALHAVLAVSAFDASGDGSPPTSRLGRAGIHRRGVALRAPGVLETALQPGPHDRLWLSLAVVGARQALDVLVDDTLGALAGQRVRCAPGDGWRDLRLDLTPLAGRATRLRLRLEAPDLGRTTTLFVGGILRLGPDGRELPDVLLYVEDTLRADVLGLYGSQLPTDATLAAIAAGGVLVEQVVAASNWTRPSISTLLTGLDPLAHGNTTHLRRVPEGVETLAEVLAAHGYQTAAFVTNYHTGGWSGLDQGFDRFDEPTAHGATQQVDTLTSALIAAPLAEHLAQHVGERLFVWAHSLDPHAPYEPSMEDLLPMLRAEPAAAPAAPGAASRLPDSAELEDAWLRYAGEVRHNDRQLQAVETALAASGRSGRTLFVFASDHGEAFGEHGQREHRQSLHQEELAVPWVLRWPGRLPAGRRVPGPAGHIDMAPSLLGLLELDVPASWQGRDLSSWLAGHAGNAHEGSGAPGDSAGNPGSIDREPLLVHSVREDGLGEWVAAVRAPWKLIATLDASGAPQPLALYRLDDDPRETRDLLLDEAGRPVAQALLAWLHRQLAESRAAAAAGGEASAMSPEMLRWMQELGYLR